MTENRYLHSLLSPQLKKKRTEFEPNSAQENDAKRLLGNHAVILRGSLDTTDTRQSSKSMILCISRTRDFWPKTEAKRWGLYTSFYGIVQTNEIKSNVGFDERGKPEYPQNNLESQHLQPTHSIWCNIWKTKMSISSDIIQTLRSGLKKRVAAIGISFVFSS
mgnify:CR=1 FL=1